MAALPLLFVDASAHLLIWTTAYLGSIVVALLLLALRIAPLTDGPWFGSNKSTWGVLFGAATTTAAMVTGFAALVTLASSAALRFDASLQFLQLLSALDIAWVVTATVVGSRWIWGSGAARIAGAAMSIVCVWSIWRYLDEVGFGPGGSWLVSGDALRRLVLPYDTLAAIIALGLVFVGIRRRQATAQPNPQS